jgi:hypothetical protein
MLLTFRMLAEPSTSSSNSGPVGIIVAVHRAADFFTPSATRNGQRCASCSAVRALSRQDQSDSWFAWFTNPASWSPIIQETHKRNTNSGSRDHGANMKRMNPNRIDDNPLCLCGHPGRLGCEGISGRPLGTRQTSPRAMRTFSRSS